MTYAQRNILCQVILIAGFIVFAVWFVSDVQEMRRQQVRFSEEQNAYLQLVEMGLPKWQMSCALIIGREGGNYAEVERKCSANFPRVGAKK